MKSIILVKNPITLSLLIGFFSSFYFLEEIYNAAPLSGAWFLKPTAFATQVVHDGVCVYFFCLTISSLWSLRNLLLLNILHGLVMALFCYYKRCVLTLVYNYLLDLPMCSRYIPIWQRCFNMMTAPTVCSLDSYRYTYLWLNNHIIQSMIVLLANLNTLTKTSNISKNEF